MSDGAVSQVDIAPHAPGIIAHGYGRDTAGWIFGKADITCDIYCGIIASAVECLGACECGMDEEATVKYQVAGYN